MSRGSGYPSDPKTQAYLREGIDPVFGYRGIVRFSWATVKVLLDKQGVECKWYVAVSICPRIQRLMAGRMMLLSHLFTAGSARMAITTGLKSGARSASAGLVSCNDML